MSNELTKAERIEGRIDKRVSSETSFSPSGAMRFANVEQIMEFAKVMAVASVAIPKHLRDNPGACLAVAIQAGEWEMSPFAVANKTYVVNDRLGFEAQLLNAVILRRAPIIGRFKVSYSGEALKRRCMVKARLNDGDEVEYESPEIGKITVQNSPLWKSDPDQQLFYYSSRAMCRRHFPDVILGVYTADELQDQPQEIRNASGREVPAADVPRLFSGVERAAAATIGDGIPMSDAAPAPTMPVGQTPAAQENAPPPKTTRTKRSAQSSAGAPEQKKDDALWIGEYADESPGAATAPTPEPELAPDSRTIFWARCGDQKLDPLIVMSVLRRNGMTDADYPADLAEKEAVLILPLFEKLVPLCAKGGLK